MCYTSNKERGRNQNTGQNKHSDKDAYKEKEQAIKQTHKRNKAESVRDGNRERGQVSLLF